jgi:hypothetical protein
MRRGLGLLAVVAVVVSAASTTTAARALADDKTRCISASEQGQQLRDDGRYSQARDAFTTCSRDACPAIVRRDCTRWLAELEELWPSVVFGAKDDAGRDLSAVRVSMDGKPLAASVDGKPLFVDPGAHVFRFEAEGYAPVEQDVVMHASEKGRAIDVQFGPGGTAATPLPRAARKGTPAPPTDAAADASPWAWVLAGAAVVSFGTEAYFGVSGLGDRSNLESQPCARTATCNAGSVQSVRNKFAVADVALGVGIVSAALSAYLFLSHDAPAKKPEAGHVDLTPVPGGGVAVVGGSF